MIALTACATAPSLDSYTPPAGSFTLRAKTEAPAFTFDVQLSEGRSLPFLLDTGSTATAIYRDTAAALGIAPEDEMQANVRGLGGMVQAPVVALEDLQIGDAGYPRLRAVLLSRQRDMTVSGIIGLDILFGYALIWDASDSLMTFVPSEALDADFFRGWDRVDLTLDQLTYAKIRLFGNDVDALIDTGSAATLSNWEALSGSATVRNVRARMQRQWRLEGAAGSFEPKAVARLPAVSLGEHRLEGVRILVNDLPALREGSEPDEPLAIIGADLLSTRDFVFHPAGEILLFLPPDLP